MVLDPMDMPKVKELAIRMIMNALGCDRVAANNIAVHVYGYPEE